MKLPPVPNSETMLDIAFKRSKKVQSSNKNREKKAREEEIGRINSISDTLTGILNRILNSFPMIDRLDPFFASIIESEFGSENIRRALSKVNWANKKITVLANESRRSIQHETNLPSMTKTRRSFSGRASSVIEDLEEQLDLLEKIRLFLKTLPEIKTEVPTVVIAGMPNVGKSLIVKSITAARPEVAEYPFTTKSVSIGHLEYKGKRIQVVDIPGLLDRKQEKRNAIENRGLAALKETADLVIYVFDPSETCGFSMDEQTNLRKEISEMKGFTIIDVSNKADITEPLEDTLAISALMGQGLELLIEAIGENLSSQQPPSQTS